MPAATAIAAEAAIIGPIRRATRRAADAGATRTATTSRFPSREREQDEQRDVDDQRAHAEARRAEAVEAHREQPAVQQP